VKLSIPKPDLVRALASVKSAADRKATNPQLGNALITADGERLTLAATDLYVGVRTSLPAKVHAPGSVSIPAQRLFDAVKSLPEGDVSIEVENSSATIKSGKSRFKLPALPGEDFPRIPVAPADAVLTIDAAHLAEMIGAVRHAVTDGNARPHLEGALFQVESETFRIVATDGHRLALVERKVDANEFKAFLPARGVGELARFAEGSGQIWVGLDEGSLFFTRDGSTLHTKLADDAFPPYGRIIPDGQARSIVVARDALIDAARRARVVVAEASKLEGCQLRLDEGSLRLHRVDPDAGEFSDEVATDYGGQPLTIGVSIRYLAEALAALTYDEVRIGFGDELAPITLRPVGGELAIVHVVMPMRLT
jgi:DNA polymerase-3 subunit beta